MRLKPEHPAVLEARTIHVGSKKPVGDKPIIKMASNNRKLAGDDPIIWKGPWKGFPMFSVTLEERATCPTDCHHWRDCYGNNMAFAHRFEHGPKFEAKIREEVEVLIKRYRNIVVRLHILGDFYSVEYVSLWDELLSKYPGLHIFGYTARHNDKIALSIRALNTFHANKCVIRTSRNKQYDPNDPYTRYAATNSFSEKAIDCPEQTGKVSGCAQCGLCFNPKFNTTVRFATH